MFSLSFLAFFQSVLMTISKVLGTIRLLAAHCTKKITLLPNTRYASVLSIDGTSPAVATMEDYPPHRHVDLISTIDDIHGNECCFVVDC